MEILHNVTSLLYLLMEIVHNVEKKNAHEIQLYPVSRNNPNS